MIQNKLRNFAKKKYKSIIQDVLSKNNQNDLRILDVGAGNCWLLHLLPNEYMKIGLDLHSHQHFNNNIFRDFLEGKSSHFMFGDATKLPFQDEDFDIVYSNEFVSHVKDINETLIEQIRVLKKDGILLIMDSNPINPQVFIDCFIINYFKSRNSIIKRGGLRWLFHRDEPFYELAPIKGEMRMVYWKDENIHTKYWWEKKLRSYSQFMDFNISSFWSYIPISSFNLFANKILIIGRKL